MDFVLVVSMDDKAKSRARQKDKPKELVSEPDSNDNVKARVWVRTWSEIISEAERRLDFVKNEIAHHPYIDDALYYLRTRHGDVVPRQSLNSSINICPLNNLPKGYGALIPVPAVELGQLDVGASVRGILDKIVSEVRADMARVAVSAITTSREDQVTRLELAS